MLRMNGAATQIASGQFDDDLFRLPPGARERIQAKIDLMGSRLAASPHFRTAGSERSRLRIGDYRVIYRFDLGKRGIYLLAVGHRREIYQLVQRFHPEFEAVYEERYQERYGFWASFDGRPARTVITVCRSASGRPDAVPGVVGAIQTFGQLIHFHPPIHALVTEGVFLPETGAFLLLPKLASEPFLKLWEQEVFALLLAEGKITEEVVTPDPVSRMVLEQERNKEQREAPDANARKPRIWGLVFGARHSAIPVNSATSPPPKILPVDLPEFPPGQNPVGLGRQSGRRSYGFPFDRLEPILSSEKKRRVTFCLVTHSS
jgi:mRNA interferase RelE/StbE